MPVSTRRTRANIRQSVGMGLNVIDLVDETPTISVTGTSSVGALLAAALSLDASGSSNEHRGKWAICAAGSSNASSNVGLSRRVSASTSSNGRLAFLSDWPVIPDTSQTFELWNENVPPALVHDFINQAIMEATKKGSVAVQDLTIHTGRQRAFPFTAGSSLIGVQEVEWRSVWDGEKVTTADNAMSSGTDADVTTDSEDFKEGSASNRIAIAATVSSAAVVATDSFTAVDLRGYTHLEFWMKSNLATTSSAIRVRLGEGSTNRETLNVPAMNADSWTYQRIALSSAETDSAITRFMVTTGASDMASVTIWVDDVTVTRAQSEHWERINPRFWGGDQDARALVFEADATLPYALLRITGRRAPNLLTADSAVSDLPPEYVINSVSAKVLRSRVDIFGSDRKATGQQADFYEKLAQMHYLRMRTPASVRWIEDSN